MAQLVCSKCGGYAVILDDTDTCPRCRVVIVEVSSLSPGPWQQGNRDPTGHMEPNTRKKTGWLDRVKKHLRRIIR